MKLALLLSACGLLALGLPGSGAVAAPKATCSGGIGGSHGSITVTGTCAVAAPLTVNGDLTLADGAVFVGFGPAVHVTGSVKVGKGAQLALGYNAAPRRARPGHGRRKHRRDATLSLYLGNITVHGNVVSNGGGTTARFYNFPIKDNAIDGNLIIHGWTGGSSAKERSPPDATPRPEPTARARCSRGSSRARSTTRSTSPAT